MNLPSERKSWDPFHAFYRTQNHFVEKILWGQSTCSVSAMFVLENVTNPQTVNETLRDRFYLH